MKSRPPLFIRNLYKLKAPGYDGIFRLKRAFRRLFRIIWSNAATRRALKGYCNIADRFFCKTLSHYCRVLPTFAFPQWNIDTRLAENIAARCEAPIDVQHIFSCLEYNFRLIHFRGNHCGCLSSATIAPRNNSFINRSLNIELLFV